MRGFAQKFFLFFVFAKEPLGTPQYWSLEFLPSWKYKCALSCFTLAPPFQLICMGLELWANHLGKTKVLLGTHSELENSLGTWWEPVGNTLGTRGKKAKNGSPHPPPPFKKRKTGPFMHACMHAEPSGCMKFLFPKLFITKNFVWANTPSWELGYLLSSRCVLFHLNSLAEAPGCVLLQPFFSLGFWDSVLTP